MRALPDPNSMSAAQHRCCGTRARHVSNGADLDMLQKKQGNTQRDKKSINHTMKQHIEEPKYFPNTHNYYETYFLRIVLCF